MVDQDERDLESPVKRVVDVLELVLCSWGPSWLKSSSPSVSEYLSKEEECPNDRRWWLTLASDICSKLLLSSVAEMEDLLSSEVSGPTSLSSEGSRSNT